MKLSSNFFNPDLPFSEAGLYPRIKDLFYSCFGRKKMIPSFPKMVSFVRKLFWLESELGSPVPLYRLMTIWKKKEREEVESYLS